MTKDDNSSLQPGKTYQEGMRLPTEDIRQADSQQNKAAINKKEHGENNEEVVEVDEFGRMLRRDNRQRDEECDYSDHSDHDRSDSRRRSSSNRSSRHRYSDDHYESKTNNYYYRKYQLDRYIPKKSSYARYSDSDREENSRSVDLQRERKRSRTWSRRSSDDSDDDYHYRRSSSRRLRSREESSEHKRRWSQLGLDPYLAASEYIDTEFYTKKVFVGELRNVSERALYNAFERFGDIENIDWLPEKGIAFIDFDTEENAAEARRKMNGTLLGLNPIQVNRAKRPERNINGFGNVPWSDADGAEARKNEKKNSYALDGFFPEPPVQTVVSPAVLDPRAQIPKRKIIAYDDL